MQDAAWLLHIHQLAVGRAFNPMLYSSPRFSEIPKLFRAVALLYPLSVSRSNMPWAGAWGDRIAEGSAALTTPVCRLGLRQRLTSLGGLRTGRVRSLSHPTCVYR
jgi:hypothetical protein